MKEKFTNKNRRWVFLIFLECVKMTFVGLKLIDHSCNIRKLFLEYSRSENSNVVAGVPVPMGYDSVYDSACVSPWSFSF